MSEEKKSGNKQGKKSGFSSKLGEQAASLLYAKEELEKKNIELETAIAEAKRANHARDIFLANMSHEIRTPINTILGLNELILRESQDDAVREYALEIKQAGSVLVSLVSDILDFSRIESGKMEIAEGTYDISSLLNNLINNISIPLRKKKLQLVLDIASDVPYKLSGDEVHLHQIIGNLLSNAVKYTKAGSVTFRLKWKWKDKKQERILLTVTVEDTGIGIKKADIDQIFNTFNQIDMKTTRVAEGVGLGLAVTHRLLEIMGSKLEVQSDYGKGSVFSFTLEQEVMDKEPLGNFEEQYDRSLKKSIRYREKFIAPLGKILIVDDNAMNLAVAQDLLRKTKLQIDVASSGDECLELVKRKAYHLICMDHMMPVMDGVETMKAIRALEGNPSQNIPIIALTANAVVGARDFYLQQGFEDYLTKPIEPEKLEDMMIKYLPKELVYLSDDTEQDKEDKEEGPDLDEERLLDIGINASNGLRYMGGNKILYEKVLRDFREMLTEKEEQLSGMIKKADASGYRILVHALKGNARNVGADELAEEAFSLEKKSKDDQFEEVETESPILFGMMQTLGKNLDLYLGSDEKQKKEDKQEKKQKQKDISEKDWKKHLQLLYQQLDDFDQEGANETLGELKQCQLSEEQKKLLRLCTKALGDFAYDVAMEIVESAL